MAVDGAKIRRVLLETCKEKAALGEGHFQAASILSKANGVLGLRTDEEQQALLTVWHDLFRVGVLSWGHNLSNPDPPFVHLTEVGRRSLENLSRDPYNADGYMAAVRPYLGTGSVAESYIEEAVGTFGGGFLKATAVMVGAAVESLVLDLRDTLVSRLEDSNESVPNKVKNWKVKTVRDGLADFFEQKRGQMDHTLRERCAAYWMSMTDQARLARNDAGHPASVSPVTHETVHAALLLFPELAALTRDLKAWVINDSK